MTIHQQNETPKDGDIVEIENFDGELLLTLNPSIPLSELILQWPKSPFRASRVKIYSSQRINSIIHVGQTLAEDFSGVDATGSAGFVWCSLDKKYLPTGVNRSASIVRPAPDPTKPKMGIFKRMLAAFGI